MQMRDATLTIGDLEGHDAGGLAVYFDDEAAVLVGLPLGPRDLPSQSLRVPRRDGRHKRLHIVVEASAVMNSTSAAFALRR